MIPGRRRLSSAVVMALVLLVATALSTVAAPQPPLQMIVKTGSASLVPVDGTIGYAWRSHWGPEG